MKTVSLPIAEQLKNAGLKWEPQKGDMFLTRSEGIQIVLIESEDKVELKGGLIWIPTLSDILDELEKIGYWFEFGQLSREKCYCIIFDGPDSHSFYGETWEDAAAKALLWALGQAKEEK